MSDPIAAAEAAGKARDIANRFETAVFLIAYGIAEKDGLYEADPHRYPYSQAFRHGMNILAALCAECSDDAEELLPTFNESDFIRNSAASDVREWTARWRDECREAVEGCRSIEIGPLASVDGDYFAATSECYEVLRFAENDLLGGHQERRVYEFLRAGTQEQYVYGRRMLIRHPLLTWNEYVRIKTGLALGDPDPLDQGEADTIDPVWLQEFVSMAYEPVPGTAKVCPNCGWTMTMRGKQPHCSSATCAKAVTGDFDKLDSVAHDAFRLSRGVMHYISSPGKLELAIAEAAAGLGLKYEMWPLKDTCDILIHLPDGRQLAVDAKAYGRAERLAREIEDDAQYKWSARGSKYDSPTAAFCEKTINEYCLLSPGGEAEALASVKYAEALRGCMVQLYKNDMRVNLPAPLHLAGQVEEYIWDWELTGRR